MKKASLSLISNFNRQRLRGISSFLTRDYISVNSPSSSSSSSPLHSIDRRIQSCAKTHVSILKTIQFQTNPYRYLGSLAGKPTQLSSRQRKLREKSDLEEAFESANTSEEMLKAFKDMEACEDPEKALSFAEKALRALDQDGKPSLLVAMALQLMGSVNYSLKRFSDSLGYLNRANRLLGRLEEEKAASVEDIRPVLHAVQLELGNVKTAMGRREEALENLKKALEIKEMTLEKDCKELGVAYRDLAEAYVSVLNFKEALPFGLKALEIHIKELGHNSVEVAHDRRILGVIYTGMEEHAKALEQNELSQKVLKNWGLGSDLLRAEIDAANMQIAYSSEDRQDSENRALVFISMGKALCNQEKIADSKRCLEIACGILDKKERVSPIEVAEAYSEISMQYDSMNEFETAISLLKRALALLAKQPQVQHSEGSVSARIGWLLLLTGEVPQAIPYLESAAEIMKESFGSKHFGVGYIYNNLGAAYLELDRPQSAAQMFAVAKDIMDVSLGPHHVDSIEACQNLSKAYSAMGSYPLAIEFQQRVIDAWEGHGASAEAELREAQEVLKELKIKARGKSTNLHPTKALPLPQHSLASRNLQPDVPLNQNSASSIR
ncbi:RING-H2 finger protein ATL1-like [Hibiscus syriacus]|uniref:RING-H2 finger protein ATL1-like n=1 Tax=Hibiscus syriacus TaxID=106335 RepID=A0A6A2YQW5_HIBSY|nr:RING-H2 finger protein ATL1-like [Hibiscus syriacus]